VREDRTYGLSPARLGRLLALGQQGGPGQANPRHGPTVSELLQEILSSDLPLDPTLPDSLPVVLNWPSHEVLAVSGQTIGELLLDCRTDLEVIKTLKDYGKELARRGRPGMKQAAATAIYYAAIASALVFHRHKITKHSYRSLQEAYAELEQKPWVSSGLKDLFRRALAVCRQRMGEPQ
jgi:hypothetical protein